MYKIFALCLMAVFTIVAAKPGYVGTYASAPLIAASPYAAYASPYEAYTSPYAAYASPYYTSYASPYVASSYVASPYVDAAYSAYSPYNSLLLRR